MKQAALFDDGDAERAALEARWLSLTREDMPSVARDRQWPVHFDHCFQRIFLDHACGGVWYDHIEGRPAYRRAPLGILRDAVAAAEEVLRGDRPLGPLNDQSLQWRGKR